MDDAMTARTQAHHDALRLEISSIAEKLQDTLGQQITAFAVGLKDPRAIGKYARGENPKEATKKRLRELYVIVQVLLARETAETVRAWMIGAHPLLEDRAPAELLHEANSAPVERTATSDARSSYQSVVLAAEDFVGV